MSVDDLQMNNWLWAHWATGLVMGRGSNFRQPEGYFSMVYMPHIPGVVLVQQCEYAQARELLK